MASNADDADFKLSAACCGGSDASLLPLPVVPMQNYTKKGRHEKLGDLDLYVTAPEKSKAPKEAVIVIYDIVGYGAVQNFQAVDVMSAASGRLCVMPDVFRGVPFPAERFDWGGSAISAPLFVGSDASDRHPQGYRNSLSKEINQYVARGGGSYSRVVKKDLENVIAWLKERGIERACMVGFCYGGVVTIKSSQDFYPFLSGVCGIHPALMPLTDAAKVRTPVASLPSSIDDPSFDEFYEALRKNTNIPRPTTFSFNPLLHQPFHDVRHGWCTARGDFENPLVKRRAEEAFAITVEFFENCFKLDDERRLKEGKGKL